MKRVVVLGLLAVLATAAAATAVAALNDNFGAHLNGRNERPDPRETQAQGQALFHLSDDGQSMDYKLIASNIENAFMAHIHIGPAEGTGPIAVWLFPGTAPVPLPLPDAADRVDGVIATGTFTAANFVGPLAGHPMSDLVSAIEAGNAYVNVHTNDGIAPPNTGPGDFPGGEIRAQLEK
jgi:CHRD domain